MPVTAEEFKKQPIQKWVVTDSDGTVAPFVNLAQMDLAKPPKEFIDAIRKLSFENPDVGIVILSGRKNGELNNFYKEVMRPNEDGLRPKFILASENGAFMQFKPIDDTAEKLISAHENLQQMATPLSEGLKTRIQKIMSDAAGEQYTTDTADINKWIRAEIKTYGVTCHYREPENEADKAAFQEVKDNIQKEFENLDKEAKDEYLEVHLGATGSMTLEKVSKGLTIAKIADNDKQFQDVCQENGIVTGKTAFISYSGDDPGDRPALQALNDRFEEGSLKGYTSRPCNYTPYDPEDRVPNGPKELFVRDTMYIPGEQDKLAQDIHRENFVNLDTLETLNDVRASLSEAGLQPSQNEEQGVPPIVLLSSGAILLQQPELYPEEKLDQLAKWSNGKVILMANEPGEKKAHLERLAEDNANLTVVDTEGQFYKEGKYSTVGEGLSATMDQQQITSPKGPERVQELKFLRGIQALVKQHEQSLTATQEQATGMAALGAAASGLERLQAAQARRPSSPKNTEASKRQRRL